MQNAQFHLLVIASVLSHVLAIDVCSSFTYCEDGYHCCDNDTQCCSDADLAVGAIVGIVIGSLLFISCIVAVVCCFRRKRQQGFVHRHAQEPGVTVISTNQQHGQPMHSQPLYGQQHGQPMYSQPMYGQKHGQPMHSQPMYGQQSLGHPPVSQPRYGGQQTEVVVKTGASNHAYPPPDY